MRYLILTDLHGNIDALNAVNESFDALIILGDLVGYGAAPGEVIDWVRERQPAAVSGNHDYATHGWRRVAQDSWLQSLQ